MPECRRQIKHVLPSHKKMVIRLGILHKIFCAHKILLQRGGCMSVAGTHASCGHLEKAEKYVIDIVGCTIPEYDHGLEGTESRQ